MSKVEVNEIDKQNGSTLTIGGSGTTVQLGTGATQTGFGRSGSVNWCTTAKTSPFTAENGKGYFVNTTSGGVTVTLPSSPSAGDIVAVADLNGTFDSNAVVLCRNSSKIKGACNNLELTDERVSATIVYTGASQGWITVNAANETAPTLKPQTYNVQYLVVAGGGGGAPAKGSGVGTAGGGAGGFRTIACKSFPVNRGQAYSITVGGGGAGGTTCASGTPITPCAGRGLVGVASVFSTITSAGGGRSGRNAPSGNGGGGADGAGGNGGSGGGGGTCSGNAGTGSPGGTGNTPPVNPPQGNNGGAGTTRGSSPYGVGAGGGGAGAVGQNGGPSPGAGGAGAASTILGSSPLVPSYGVAPNPSNTGPGRYFAGGGGGGWNGSGSGGHGGGGAGGSGGNGVTGTDNTGGGGGADSTPSPYGNGGNGGSGIVIIRHATADGGSGGNATATCGSDTIRVFTGDGTFTA